MRRARIKLPGEGFYHVVSRIGGRRFLLDDREKAILLRFIRAAAAFSGVEVYTYAVMDNHFHLLLRVPRATGNVSDARLRERMRSLYGPERSQLLFDQWAKWEKTGNQGRVQAEKARLRARMGDLSQFCKTFKEAFTQDYNRRHGNTGTIWEGRFKSILLEGSRRALMTVAGYIHLNPVRAEVVPTAEDARFTGYGAACHGNEAARQGLQSLVSQAFDRDDLTWQDVQSACRAVLEGAVDQEEADGECLSVQSTDKEQNPEALPLRALLRHRQSGFLNGGILGRPIFLQKWGRMLPVRQRQRPRGVLDRCPGLGLAAALGVREIS